MSTVTASYNGIELAAVVPEALVVSVARSLTGRRRDVLVDVPGRPGSWKFPEAPGDRKVTLSIDLLADSFEDRRAACRALAAWADIGAVARLIISDEPDRYHDALLNTDGDDLVERLTHGVTDLEFIADPYPLATTTSIENFTANSNPDSGTFGVSADLATPGVIQLTPSGGGLTSIAFTLNGRTLTWAGTVAAGETLTINTISETVTLGVSIDEDLTGAFDANQVDMADVSAPDGFPELVPGSNPWSLSWTGTATSVAVSIKWRERFY